MAFDKEIQDALKENASSVFDVFQEVSLEVTKEAVKKLKQTSPKRKANTEHTYSKNWKYTQDKNRISAKSIIYGGKPTYRLAHLLEHGHAKRGGGRVDGIEHIRPVEEWADIEVVERIRKRLGGT
jgi:hypothetical protein